MLLSSIALMLSAAGASAQQTAVDIGVSAPVFSKGMVMGQVSRKDPAGVKLAPDVKILVSIGLKGQKPFWSTDISLKPGEFRSVSAPYTGTTSNVTLTLSAIALDLKEIQPADNSRDVTLQTMAVFIPMAPMTAPAPAAPTPAAPAPAAPAPAAPAPAAPAPAAPAPAAPAPPPPAATITTQQIVLVGGTQSTPTGISGSRITTSSITLIGGTQGPTPVAPVGRTITTTPITLIGK